MRNNAFTILEIMIVMVLFATVLGLGISMYGSMSRTTTVSEANSDVVSVIKATQNLAKNNSLPKSESAILKAESVYYYVLEFKDDQITRYLYRKTNGNWDLTPITVESNLKSKMFNDIKYQANQDECAYVMLENLSGRIKVAKQGPFDIVDLYNNDVEKCEMSVFLANDSYIKKIYINSITGTFGVIGETQ